MSEGSWCPHPDPAKWKSHWTHSPVSFSQRSKQWKWIARKPCYQTTVSSLSFPLLCAEMHVCCFLLWTDLPRHFSTWNVLFDSSPCLVSLMFQNLLKQKKKKKIYLSSASWKNPPLTLLADTQQPLWNYDWRFYLGLPHHWQISIRGNPEIECKRVCVILPSCFHKSVPKSHEILKWVCDLKDWDPHFLTSASHIPNVHTNYLHFIKMKIPIQ